MVPIDRGARRAYPLRMNRRIVALSILNLADGFLTLAGLGRGYSESMPVAQGALILGAFGIIALGIVGLIIELAILARLPRPFRRIGWAMVLAMASYPVIINAALLV